MGAGASSAGGGAGNVPPGGHTILKKLLNNSADAGPQGQIDVVKQETKRHGFFVAGKKVSREFAPIHARAPDPLNIR